MKKVMMKKKFGKYFSKCCQADYKVFELEISDTTQMIDVSKLLKMLMDSL